jgi:hypothetical protein
MTESHPLLKEIDAFIALHNLSPSAFGRMAMGDASFYKEVKEEHRSLTHRTEQKIRDFMANYSENSQCPKPVRLAKPGKTTKGSRA